MVNLFLLVETTVEDHLLSDVMDPVNMRIETTFSRYMHNSLILFRL